MKVVKDILFNGQAVGPPCRPTITGRVARSLSPVHAVHGPFSARVVCTRHQQEVATGFRRLNADCCYCPCLGQFRVHDLWRHRYQLSGAG